MADPTTTPSAAIEIAFALRTRWSYRKLYLVCETEKINGKILERMKQLNIFVKENIS